MNEKILNFFEGIPYVIFFVGLILGVALGFLLKAEELDITFNFIAMITTWVSTFFTGIIFLAISEALNGLYSILKRTEAIYKILLDDK